MIEKRTAVITGSTKGIGKATVLKLAADGYKVVVSGRNEASGIAVVEEIRSSGGEAWFIAADVRKEEDIKKLIDDAVSKFGAVDVMVNNAGIAGEVATPLERSTTENLRELIETNVLGLYWGMKYAILAMQQKGRGGSIINLASIAGLNGIPYTAQYCATKHAVVGLTKATAVEVAEQNIRVNAIAPGAVDTDILAGARKAAAESGTYDLGGMHPMNRIGKPFEIANAIAYIASDQSPFMTGAIISVDGGFNAK